MQRPYYAKIVEQVLKLYTLQRVWVKFRCPEGNGSSKITIGRLPTPVSQPSIKYVFNTHFLK